MYVIMIVWAVVTTCLVAWGWYRLESKYKSMNEILTKIETGIGELTEHLNRECSGIRWEIKKAKEDMNRVTDIVWDRADERMSDLHGELFEINNREKTVWDELKSMQRKYERLQENVQEQLEKLREMTHDELESKAEELKQDIRIVNEKAERAGFIDLRALNPREGIE